MWISPFELPALTFVLTFMVVFPFLEKLMSAAPLITDSRRSGRPSLDAGLNLQSSRHCLVVLLLSLTSLDASLDLQPVRHCLVVLEWHVTRFDAALHLQSLRHCLVVVVLLIGFSGLHSRFDFHK